MSKTNEKTKESRRMKNLFTIFDFFFSLFQCPIFFNYAISLTLAKDVAHALAEFKNIFRNNLVVATTKARSVTPSDKIVDKIAHSEIR